MDHPAPPPSPRQFHHHVHPAHKPELDELQPTPAQHSTRNQPPAKSPIAPTFALLNILSSGRKREVALLLTGTPTCHRGTLPQRTSLWQPPVASSVRKPPLCSSPRATFCLNPNLPHTPTSPPSTTT